MPKVDFKLVLEGDSSGQMPNGAAAVVPEKIIQALGGGGRIPIRGTIDGFEFRTTIVKMHGRFFFCVNKTMREGAGVQAGDKVRLVLDVDDQPRVVEVPPELKKALAKSKTAQVRFDALSYTHQKEHALAVTEAKRPETRARRIEQMIAKLEALPPPKTAKKNHFASKQPVKSATPKKSRRSRAI